MAALAAAALACWLSAAARAQEPQPPQGPAIFTAVGDIRLDGPIAAVAARGGTAAPLAGVAEMLTGDLLFGNLECPITERGTKTPKTWNFRAKPSSLKLLRAAGFDMLNLANNHVFDFGAQGFLDTLRHVNKEKFSIIGAGRDRAEAEAVRVFKSKDLRVGVMGFTSTHPEEAWAKPSRAGVAYSDFDRLSMVVASAKKKCDVLIVSFHGGTELAQEPNEIQKGFGRAAIDAGADLVIGHHPHVLQAVELYKGKPILHSIGNFLFVSPSTGTHLSVIAKAELTREGVSRIVFEPVDVNWGSLRRANPADAQSIFQALDRLGALSQHPQRFWVSGITPMDAPPPEKLE